MRSGHLRATLTALVVAAAACTSSGDEPGGDGTTEPSVVSTGTRTTEATILRSDDGRLEIELPAGAITTDTDAGIDVVDPASVSWLDGTRRIGAVYRLRPEGLTFPNPLTLSHRIPADEVVVGSGVPLATTLLGDDVTASLPLEQRSSVDADETYVHLSRIDRFGVVALIDGGVTLSLEPPRAAAGDGESFDVAMTATIDREGEGPWPAYDLQQQWRADAPLSGAPTEIESVTDFGGAGDDEPWVVARTLTCDIAGNGAVRVDVSARIAGTPDPRSTTVVELDSEVSCGDVGR